MSDLDEYRALAQENLDDFAGVLYPHALTFAKGEQVWRVDAKVIDPARLKREEFSLYQAAAERLGVKFQDLRVLKVHHRQSRPARGATTTLPRDLGGGTLTVLEYAQPSDYGTSTPGTCKLER